MLLLACTTVVVMAGLYVLTPLFREPKGSLEVELLAETESDRLLNRKAVIYGNLKDLEFEYKMGRLSGGDFRRLEAVHKSEAAVILQKLDQLGASDIIDVQIESDIAARKARPFSFSSVKRQDSSRCPSCGAEVIPGKRFCADCGLRL